MAGGEGAHRHRDPHISAARAHANLVNAHALENGLLWMAVIPMILKFFVYGVRPGCTEPRHTPHHSAAP